MSLSMNTMSTNLNTNLHSWLAYFPCVLHPGTWEWESRGPWLPRGAWYWSRELWEGGDRRSPPTASIRTRHRGKQQTAAQTAASRNPLYFMPHLIQNPITYAVLLGISSLFIVVVVGNCIFSYSVALRERIKLLCKCLHFAAICKH